MAIGGVKQRSRGADFDAVATLRAIKPATVVAEDCMSAAPSCFDRFFTHPFIADSRTAFAQNAALRIVCYDWRQIFFGVIVFLLREALFESTPIESHFLQFTFTTAIAHGTIERVIRQQELGHASLGFLDFFALCSDNHAVRASD